MTQQAPGLLTGESSLSERIALWVAVLFSATAAVGFATFGVRPELLGHVPWATGFFAHSFRIFSIGQILVAAGALVLLLLARAPLVRWITAFVAVYFISLGSELSGTAFGFPFGPYHYTPLLGARWFDLVPLVIPLSWFMMAIPAYYLAIRAGPQVGPLLWIPLGALILTAWDLALDPAMSYATVYWRWEVDGPYYGMPWVNLWGWLFTSLLIMGALALLRAEAWVRALPGRWLTVFYAANVLLPLIMAAAAGLVMALVVTVAGYAALAGAVWLARARFAVTEAATSP